MAGKKSWAGRFLWGCGGALMWFAVAGVVVAAIMLLDRRWRNGLVLAGASVLAFGVGWLLYQAGERLDPLPDGPSVRPQVRHEFGPGPIHSGQPDPLGRPRPPTAPRSGVKYWYPTRALHLDPRQPPDHWRIGPPDRPPLEAVVVPRWARLTEAVYHAAVPGLLVLVVYLPLLWAHHWDMPLLILWIFLGWIGVMFLWSLVFSDVPAEVPLVAGSDWVGSASGDASVVVPLYELTRIHVTRTYNELTPNGNALQLVPGGRPGYDRELAVELALVQANPALWDLVYQGIIASVAAGAELTPRARDFLQAG